MEKAWDRQHAGLSCNGLNSGPISQQKLSKPRVCLSQTRVWVCVRSRKREMLFADGGGHAAVVLLRGL